ncbi:MAG: cytochrome-c peroxidase, partial [Flavobacteriales bacterium]|nr:cytochrome-c peroxidase [Flavobacteriales bacterium]
MNLRKYYPIIALFALACSPAEEETIPTGEMRAPVLPETMFEYADVQLPEHFLTPGMSFFESTPASNPTTNAGATLGRVLFYDRELSASRSVSCGSCHKQEHGFADPAPGSTGHAGGITSRNASHLVNLRYNFRLFWDLRADGLEEQVLMPIQDELEMGMTLPMAVERVKAAPY